MSGSQSFRFFALLQRELREYRTSFLWTPIGAAAILAVIMLGSVVLANRISIVGDTILEALLAEGGNGVNVRISVNEDTGVEQTVVEIEGVDDVTGLPTGIDEPIAVIERQMPREGEDARQPMTIRTGAVDAPTVPAAPEPPSYTMTVEEDMSPELWNFSREWSFNPAPSDGVDEESDEHDHPGGDVNVMLVVQPSVRLLKYQQLLFGL